MTIETLFDKDDTVWFINKDTCVPDSSTVNSIRLVVDATTDILYILANGEGRPEAQLFATRQALIDSFEIV